MDHRELLKKYIRRVRNIEGVTFIPADPSDPTLGAPTLSFTAEEVAELEALDTEGQAED